MMQYALLLCTLFSSFLYAEVSPLSILSKQYLFDIDGTTMLMRNAGPSYRSFPLSSIAIAGFYYLAGNVANQITISASNVTLDLNGHTVSGGTNGIVVNGGLSNVTIKNGRIDGVSADGIQINGGCRNIIIQDVLIKNSIRGIYCSN